jgi:uncharacterized protein YodC (DUF2158 family)
MKLGTVVRLKSGGPNMLSGAVQDDRVHCCWLNRVDGHVTMTVDQFRIVCLDVVLEASDHGEPVNAG